MNGLYIPVYITAIIKGYYEWNIYCNYFVYTRLYNDDVKRMFWIPQMQKCDVNIRLYMFINKI